MERHLLSGDRGAALKAATDAGLWGPALLLARHCGDAAFSEAAAAMAKRCMTPGTPLATLQRSLAGIHNELPEKPSSVAPAAAVVPAMMSMGMAAAAAAAAAAVPEGEPQPLGFDTGGGAETPTKPEATTAAVTMASGVVSSSGGGGMLAEWRENVAILAANRTKGDEALLFKLGDRLWAERGDAAAAQLVYLVAGLPVQAYSPGARLCLVGADHKRTRRTYATPAAVRRTELLEWAVTQVPPDLIYHPHPTKDCLS
jgi:hypothetical protein